MDLMMNFRFSLAIVACIVSVVISEKIISEDARQETGGCNGTLTLTASEGYIISPNFPDNYENNMLCSWIIRAQSGYQIDITFTNFTLEQQATCAFDRVEIYDGSSDTEQLLGRFCGSELPPVVQSTGHEAFVRFRSDSSIVFSGFQLFYRMTSRECGGTVILTESQGIISSPNFPNNYENNMLCSWHIMVQSGFKVDISFTSFTLEAQALCLYDRVEIYDGSTDAAPLLGSFCGSAFPPDVQSTQNEAFVRFTSDASVVFPGFQLSYRMSRILPPPADCSEVQRIGQSTSAVYEVWPRSRAVNGPVNVYCDMETAGGGWTVIQRRGNFNQPTNYFYKDWEAYKTGFGDLLQDFWLGNDIIFALTNQKQVSVRFDLYDVNGTYAYAEYSTFFIDGEEHQYELHIRGYSGTADDSMIQTHNHQKFTTKDMDYDNFQYGNCAVAFKGAWWYNACHTSNLNGLNLRGSHESFADGINWLTFRGYFESLDMTEIKIR